MFGMSVKLVPGWLVAMAPSAIGVPAALTPGLLPHCEVSTVAAPAALLDADPAGVVAPVLVAPAPALLFEMLLQPAAAPAPIRVRTAARTAAPCALLALRLFMSSPSGRWRLSLSVSSRSVHVHHDLDRIRRPAHREFECLGRAGQREMVREKLANVFAGTDYQAYRVAEIRGGRGARAEDVDFLFREDPGSYGRRARGHADDHDPPGRGDDLGRRRQHAGRAAGLDDQGRPFSRGPVARLSDEGPGFCCPGDNLGTEARGQVTAALYGIDRHHPGFFVPRGGQDGQADRAGADDEHLLACSQPTAGHGVHGYRGGLDEAGAVGVEVADAEDLPGGDLEPFLQAAVEMHADEAEGRADVGPAGAAGVAAAAG